MPEDGVREEGELLPQQQRRLGERAHADILVAASLVYGFFEQQELVCGDARRERPAKFCSSHMNLTHPPECPPGGDWRQTTTNKDPGGHSDKFSV